VLVAIGGLWGTGKSLLARALAPRVDPVPGAVLLRTDVERKAMFGQPETARLPEGANAPEITRRLYAKLTEKAVRIIAAGHSVIVDAVFAQPRERSALAAAARAAGADLRGFFLSAPAAARIARVGGRTDDASDADATVAREQESYALGTIDWTMVDASGTPDETLARAEAALRGQRTPV
jgi:predicted kinase